MPQKPNLPTSSFDVADLRAAAISGAIEWQRHALERMVERGIQRSDVLDAISSGLRIEDYPSSTPYPSALILGWSQQRPLHIVTAYNALKKKIYIVTVYEPDLQYFESDYRTRKRKQ